MEQRTEPDVSPYRVFSRAEWAKLREDTPMTLETEEIVPNERKDDPKTLRKIAQEFRHDDLNSIASTWPRPPDQRPIAFCSSVNTPLKRSAN